MSDKTPSELLKEVLQAAMDERRKRAEAPTGFDNSTFDGVISMGDGHLATTESASLTGAELMQAAFLMTQSGYAVLADDGPNPTGEEPITRAIILHQPSGHPFGIPERLLIIPKDLNAFLDLAWNCLAPWFGPDLTNEILNSPEVLAKMKEHMDRESTGRSE